MQARFYVSSVGRFASADSIIPDPLNPQSYNRFSWVLNNPVKHRDPTGRFHVPSPDEPLTTPDIPYTPPFNLTTLLGTNFRFTGSPVPLNLIEWTGGFGPNSFAQETCDCPCSTGTPVNCYYRSTRGIHNGLDLGVPDGSPVVWTGNMAGTVEFVGEDYGDATPNVVVLVEGRRYIFGHLSSIAVDVGDEVTAGTLLGTTGSGHLHLGIKAGGDFYNPLYFFPKEIADEFVVDMTDYVVGETAWSIVRYTNTTVECGRYYWGDESSRDRTDIWRR